MTPRDLFKHAGQLHAALQQAPGVLRQGAKVAQSTADLVEQLTDSPLGAILGMTKSPSPKAPRTSAFKRQAAEAIKVEVLTATVDPPRRR